MQNFLELPDASKSADEMTYFTAPLAHLCNGVARTAWTPCVPHKELLKIFRN